MTGLIAHIWYSPYVARLLFGESPWQTKRNSATQHDKAEIRYSRIWLDCLLQNHRFRMFARVSAIDTGARVVQSRSVSIHEDSAKKSRVTLALLLAFTLPSLSLCFALLLVLHSVLLLINTLVIPYPLHSRQTHSPTYHSVLCENFWSGNKVVDRRNFDFFAIVLLTTLQFSQEHQELF